MPSPSLPVEIESWLRTAMEHSSPEEMKKYLHDHPDADPSNHSVKKADPHGAIGLLDMNTRGLTLSKPTWDSIKDFKKSLTEGKVTPKDVSNFVEDLGFDLAQAKTKGDAKSKKTVKSLENIINHVKSDSFKKHVNASTGLKVADDFYEAVIVRNVIARAIEADELQEEESAADKVKKHGEWNLVISKSRRTRWDFFMQNPHGGGFGSSSYPSVKAAIAAGTRVKDWGGKDKIWVIIQEWDGDNYQVKKTFWQPVPMDKIANDAERRTDEMVHQLKTKGEIDVKGANGKKFTIRKVKRSGISSYDVIENGKVQVKGRMMNDDDLWTWLYHLAPG